MAAPKRRSVTAVIVVAIVVLVGSTLAITRPWTQARACPPDAENPSWSVPRRWDEALLDAIRRALPNPPVHARNLFHLSVAMWDAWATYDPTAAGYIFAEKHRASDVDAARDEAMSYAAFRVLSSRFIKSVGGADSLSQFADVMDSLCYPLDVTATAGDTPAAIGNRIAAAVLEAGLGDGSNQAGGYAAPDYVPVNEPMVVAEPGTAMRDPSRWQPLQLEHMISQNGIPVTNGVQQNVGPHWGRVAGFGLPDVDGSGVPIDPGPAPRFGEPAFTAMAVDVIRDSSELDAEGDATIDISPANLGNNPLGSDDGSGHPVNPVTGRPYARNVVKLGDFSRILAEYWADGPHSETPPGHWNVIANVVSDQLGADLRIGGTGQPVDRRQWDVKLYLALNGAVHDAAIAAWGVKGHYDTARPISMIRYLAGLGQSSDPSLPSYDKDGLPLIPGLIELVTDATAGSGGRHAAAGARPGEIAVRAWAGNPEDPRTASSGVSWIRGVEWVPYQLPTFVTPAFSSYISGHSTFSRAAAEVLAGITGTPFFPGGLSEQTFEPGTLRIEAGPAQETTLQWATYYDAADQAGQSRLYGGIHIKADDLMGRRVGSECGKLAWALAQRYFDGSAGL